MAKKSFDQKFPFAKWIFLFAILLTVPITIYSFNNASTETRSNAYIEPIPTTGSLAKATGLGSSVWYCKRINYDTGKYYEYDIANFWWKAVPYATNYAIYYRKYGTTSWKAKFLGNVTNYLFEGIYTNLKGTKIQWYVKAYNSSSLSNSNMVLTPTAFESCGS